MDYEDFVVKIYNSICGIELLSNIIYKKISNNMQGIESRKEMEKLLLLNYAIKLFVKNLKKQRKTAYEYIDKTYYHKN